MTYADNQTTRPPAVSNATIATVVCALYFAKRILALDGSRAIADPTSWMFG
jgi:hypothetical protein